MNTERYDRAVALFFSVVKIFFYVFIFVGVLVTIVYCMSIGFYPSGLTIGDTLFFILASFSFVFTYSLTVLALYSAGVALTPLSRIIQIIALFFVNSFFKIKKLKPISPWVTFPKLNSTNVAPFILGVFVIIFMVLALIGNPRKAFDIAMIVFLMSFIYGLINTKPRMREYKEDWRKKSIIFLLFIVYFSPLLLMRDKSNFINHPMRMMGVRIEESTILLSSKYTQFLSSNKVEYKSISTKGEGEYDATILFRGIGNSAFIEVGQFKLIIPSSDIVIGVRSKADLF